MSNSCPFAKPRAYRGVALQCPLVPTFVCPFGPNPDFIERALLNDIIAQRQPGSRHALVGGAGMGYGRQSYAKIDQELIV